jgi:hypothetical protein
MGPALAARLRRLYFERELADLGLQVMADPAEPQVLVLPLGPDLEAVTLDQATAALERLELTGRLVEDQARWQSHERAVAIPWRRSPSSSS